MLQMTKLDTVLAKWQVVPRSAAGDRLDTIPWSNQTRSNLILIDEAFCKNTCISK